MAVGSEVEGNQARAEIDKASVAHLSRIGQLLVAHTRKVRLVIVLSFTPSTRSIWLDRCA